MYDGQYVVRAISYGLPVWMCDPHVPALHRAVCAGLLYKLRSRLEDAVARSPTAVERCAVLGRLEGLPVLVPRSEQRDHHHQWRPGANQGHRVRPRVGRERGIDVELELYAPRSEAHGELLRHCRSH